MNTTLEFQGKKIRLTDIKLGEPKRKLMYKGTIECTVIVADESCNYFEYVVDGEVDKSYEAYMYDDDSAKLREIAAKHQLNYEKLCDAIAVALDSIINEQCIGEEEIHALAHEVNMRLAKVEEDKWRLERACDASTYELAGYYLTLHEVLYALKREKIVLFERERFNNLLAELNITIDGFAERSGCTKETVEEMYRRGHFPGWVWWAKGGL